MTRSNPASAGSHVSLRFSTTSSNRKRVQFLRLNSGSLAQWRLGLSFSSFGSVAVTASGEQPWIKRKWFGLADGDFLEVGMRRVEQKIGFAGNDGARQHQNRRTGCP